MLNIIEEVDKDPLGAMLLDYLHGRHDAFVEVESVTFDMWKMKGQTMFRSYSEMDELERTAVQLCEGKTLDVGAGSGCHSLYLQQRRKLEVDALDISPGCVQVMAQRGVKNTIHQSLFSLEGRKYKTVLMLMNGLGICGTLDGCNLFLQFIKTILEKDGQVLADSTNLASLYEDQGKFDCSEDRYYGETEFVMKYRGIRSDPFNWIYIDFQKLEILAAINGLQCEQLTTGRNGNYLARIF